MRYDNVLFLTACVNPNGMAFTKLQDGNVRLQQYKKALDWYLEHSALPILVVENTMTDFSADYQSYIDSGRLEYLTFDGNLFDKSKGKGYGEMLIMKYGMEHSHFLKEARQVTKITGRLIIRDLSLLLWDASRKDDVYANVDISRGKCFCASYMFVAPTEYLRSYFIPSLEKVNDSHGYYFEHLLFETSMMWTLSGHRLNRFMFPVIVDGISGTQGTAYENARFGYPKAFIKWMLYKLHLLRFVISKKEWENNIA